MNSVEMLETASGQLAGDGVIIKASSKSPQRRTGGFWWNSFRRLAADLRGALYHSFLWLVSLLPTPLAFQTARRIGRLQYRRKRAQLGPLRSEIVATLGASPQRAEDLIARSHEMASWENLEPFFRRRLNRESVGKFLSIRGIENLNRALERGKGALLCTGHIRGLFIFITALDLLGYKMNAIRRAPINVQGPVGRLLNRRMTLMTGGKCNFLWMQEANLAVALQAAKALRRNEVVIMLIDSRFGTEAVGVRFLNRQSALPSGHVVLAQSCSAPLLNFFVRSAGSGLPRIAEIEEPHYVGDDVAASVQHCITHLEDKILQSPSDWIWLQERGLWNRDGRTSF